MNILMIADVSADNRTKLLSKASLECYCYISLTDVYISEAVMVIFNSFAYNSLTEGASRNVSGENCIMRSFITCTPHQT
jgi:hypothetical protein